MISAIADWDAVDQNGLVTGIKAGMAARVHGVRQYQSKSDNVS